MKLLIPAEKNPGASNHSDPAFAGFANPAIIRPLSSGCRCHRPVTASHYNDDVMIEGYQSAAFLCADKQRRGIHDASVGCREIKEHASRALRGGFPPAQDAPSPMGTKRRGPISPSILCRATLRPSGVNSWRGRRAEMRNSSPIRKSGIPSSTRVIGQQRLNSPLREIPR